MKTMAAEIDFEKQNAGYNYVHEKRPRPNKDERRANQQKGSAKGAFSPQGKYTQEQRKGEFSFDTIHGLKLKEVEYTVPPKKVREDRREEFSGTREKEGVRSKFLKMLVKEHEAELVEKLSLTDRDLEGMRNGRCPPGLNVHHKQALHGGGKNEFSNFILTPLYPHDQWHHDIMDPQLAGIREGETRTIKIPYTDEMIYDPKKYGFTRENQPVKPNYTSCVNPAKYPNLYKAEHMGVAHRAKTVAPMYAEIDERRKQQEKQKQTQAAAMKAAAGRGR